MKTIRNLKSGKAIRKHGKHIRQANEMYGLCGCNTPRREGKPWGGILNYNSNETFLKEL